jgi:ribosomal protein S18 acetylase RimI-like enzyme
VKQNEGENGYPRGIGNVREFLSNEETKHAWVAEKDGSIIGHISAADASDDDLSVKVWNEKGGESKSIAILKRLFVKPSCRKVGAATQLVDTAVAAFVEKGKQLVLFVLVGDEAAMRLYQKLGWVEYGRSTFHYEGDREMEAICLVNPGSN